ncbi:hypothetical protein [Vibrio astriarenae]|uniref:hypothetical protein n=1 Tax=Vibrio astriarenae TaxID=1481923 RepID=UPI0037351126
MEITEQPQSQTVNEGELVYFSVSYRHQLEGFTIYWALQKANDSGGWDVIEDGDDYYDGDTIQHFYYVLRAPHPDDDQISLRWRLRALDDSTIFQTYSDVATLTVNPLTTHLIQIAEDADGEGDIGFGPNGGALVPDDIEGETVTYLVVTEEQTVAMLEFENDLVFGQVQLDFLGIGGTFNYSSDRYISEDIALIDLIAGSIGQTLRFSLSTQNVTSATLDSDTQDESSIEWGTVPMQVEFSHTVVGTVIHSAVEMRIGDTGDFELIRSRAFTYNGESITDTEIIDNIPHPDDGNLQIRWRLRTYADTDEFEVYGRISTISAIARSTHIMGIDSNPLYTGYHNLLGIGTLEPDDLEGVNVDRLILVNSDDETHFRLSLGATPYEEVVVSTGTNQTYSLVRPGSSDTYITDDPDLVSFFTDNEGEDVRVEIIGNE